MSAKHPVPAPCRPQDSNRPVPPAPPRPREYAQENQQLRTTIAELVGLLRMGKELAEAAGDATFYSGIKMKRAISDRDRILGLYDAAIARHGGEA